ncbi:MAG: formate dehydrogenase accessory sulfurtransferase FdhD, partial [Pseudomonadota bacterium]
MKEFAIRPNPDDPRLTRTVPGVDESGQRIETQVVVERPLTLFLNGQEIVTMMTVGDYPDYLAVGYLVNQNMLRPDDVVTGIDYDDELETVVVRTKRKTNYEKKLRKKTLTSGCAQGTVFGDLMEEIDSIRLRDDVFLADAQLFDLIEKVRRHETIYKQSGAVHGCALARASGPASTEIMMFIEDVGRHNAVDAIAGRMWLEAIEGSDKIFYTTG